jgi:DNA-binding response OmpR family regulator
LPGEDYEALAGTRQRDVARMSHILVVEDDPDLRPLLEHVLISGGYTVDVTDTVAGGLARLDEHAYDLVLADGRLSDGTGMMVAERAIAKRTKVLIITGYAFDLPRAELERYYYILKPVRPSELLAEIERVLGSCGAN